MEITTVNSVIKCGYYVIDQIKMYTNKIYIVFINRIISIVNLS